MHSYSEKQLDLKIQEFMARKTQQYPELMKTEQTRVLDQRVRQYSTPFLSSMRALKPQLLG